MSFALYLTGLVLVVCGIAWGLVALHVPHVYVGIVTLIVLGAGVMSAVSHTRTKDISR